MTHKKQKNKIFIKLTRINLNLKVKKNF